MSRLDDAIRDAEDRETERAEIAAGDPIGAEIPALTDIDRLNVKNVVDSIDRHSIVADLSPEQGKPSKPYVQPFWQRHPDSEA